MAKPKNLGSKMLATVRYFSTGSIPMIQRCLGRKLTGVWNSAAFFIITEWPHLSSMAQQPRNMTDLRSVESLSSDSNPGKVETAIRSVFPDWFL